MRFAAGALIAVVGLLATATPSQAAFPGKNGKIAFASDRDGDFEIYAMNPDGSGQTPLTSNTVADENPAWSPDGIRIAFERGGQIWVMNADGTGQFQTTSLGESGDPAWSPDGVQVAFRYRQGISVTYPDGTGNRGLTASAGSSVEDSEPAWSPDGTTILFTRRADQAAAYSIYAMNSDGTGVRPVSSSFGNDRGPSWAPAGPRFAYSRITPTSSGVQITSTTDPVHFTRLTAEHGTDPSWSPDGAKVAYAFSQEVRAISAEERSGTGVNLTNAAGDDRDPDWQSIPVNGYPRPQSAPTISVSLVPAYAQCGLPNRRHGPPLDSYSCAPPRQASNEVTFGTPDANGALVNAAGRVTYAVQSGNPGTPGDEADVQLKAAITDVRNAGTLSDYEGGLWIEAGLRVTDKNNRPHPGGRGAATGSVTSFMFHVPCAVTPDTSIGSTCSVVTSADAVVGGLVTEGLRSVWGLGRVEVYDGTDTLFMTQGVFVP